jgi:hypothetical protein
MRRLLGLAMKVTVLRVMEERSKADINVGMETS